jgi:hypothetical protein
VYTVLTVLACAAGGGVFGALFSYWTRPRERRHRGERRPLWQRGTRVDLYPDVPLKDLDLTDAPTEQIPWPGGSVDHSKGEQ